LLELYSTLSVYFVLNQKSMSSDNQPKSKPTVKDYFAVSEVFGYFFRKPDPSRPKNFNIRAMHTINKISILMFLVGTVMFIFKMWLR
jgi:hypothetical protein